MTAPMISPIPDQVATKNKAFLYTPTVSGNPSPDLRIVALVGRNAHITPPAINFPPSPRADVDDFVTPMPGGSPVTFLHITGDSNESGFGTSDGDLYILHIRNNQVWADRYDKDLNRLMTQSVMVPKPSETHALLCIGGFEVSDGFYFVVAARARASVPGDQTTATFYKYNFSLQRVPSKDITVTFREREFFITFGRKEYYNYYSGLEPSFRGARSLNYSNLDLSQQCIYNDTNIWPSVYPDVDFYMNGTAFKIQDGSPPRINRVAARSFQINRDHQGLGAQLNDGSTVIIYRLRTRRYRASTDDRYVLYGSDGNFLYVAGGKTTLNRDDSSVTDHMPGRVFPSRDGGAWVINDTVYYNVNADRVTSNDGIGTLVFYPALPNGISFDGSEIKGTSISDNNRHSFLELYGRNTDGVDSEAFSINTWTEGAVPNPVRNPKYELGAGSVKVSWDAPLGGQPILEYQIALPHSRDQSRISTLRVSAGTNTSYSFTGLSSGLHIGEIRARNKNGWSEAIRIITRVFDGIPPAPKITSITPSEDSFTITWTQSSPTSNLDDHEIRYALVSQDYPDTWIKVPRNSSTYTVSNLSPGTYKVQFRSVNPLGAGPADEETTTLAAPPTEVTSFTSSIATKSVTFKWKAPLAGSPILRYEIRHALDSANYPDGWIQVPLTSVDADGFFTYTAAGLSDFSAYKGQVRAINAQGQGEISELRSIVPRPVIVPGKASISKITSQDQQLTVQWDAITTGAPLEYYEIIYARSDQPYPTDIDNNEVWQRVSGDGSALSFVIGMLTNGIEQKVKVRGVNIFGAGPSSDEVKATPLPEPPSRPRALSIDSQDRSLIVTWLAPVSDDATSYEIRHALSSVVFKDSDWTDIGNVLTYTIPNLNNGDTHKVEVRAKNIGGAGPSSGVSAIVGGDPPVIADISPQQLFIGQPYEFTPSVKGTLPITLSVLNNVLPSGITFDGTKFSGTPTTVQDVTSTLNAKNVVSTDSEQIEFVVSARRQPSSVQNLSFVPKDASGDLSFEAPLIGAPITRYEIRYALLSDDFPTTWTSIGTMLKTTLTGLVNNLTYKIEARAVNDIGEGPLSQITGTPYDPSLTVPDPPTIQVIRGDASVRIIIHNRL